MMTKPVESNAQEHCHRISKRTQKIVRRCIVIYSANQSSLASHDQFPQSIQDEGSNEYEYEPLHDVQFGPTRHSEDWSAALENDEYAIVVPM